MKRIMKIITSVIGVGMAVAIVGGYAFRQQSASISDVVLDSLAGAYQNDVTLANLIPSVGISGGDAHSVAASAQGKYYYTNRVVIVTFHDISPNVYSPWVITPEAFSADLDAIKAHHFNVISNQQFIDFLSHRTTVPPNAVLLTFDDGYRDMYTYAFPRLMDEHMPATFFEIVGNADKNAENFLTWSQIKEMSSAGMTFESHTYASHYEVPFGPHGSMVPVFDTRIMMDGKPETMQHYYKRVYTDFLHARLVLSSEIGKPVIEFAWPYGWGIPLATRIAHQVGYQFIYTTTNGFCTVHTNHSAIPRIDVGKAGMTPDQVVQNIINTVRYHQHKHLVRISADPAKL